MRYQQVFLGSELGTLRSVGGLCLRRQQMPGFGGTSETQQLTVLLGPTTRDYTNLTASFDANYSAPPTLVFSGPVFLPASSGGGTPDDFYICIEFETSYVPTPGQNVIVEIVNTSATSIPHFEDSCSTSAGCTTARAFAFSATATTATAVQRSGLIMKFLRGNPASKDDCKDGGWENYSFMNQGLCIRFSETGQDSR
jgi:hypothetical protein